VYNLENELRRFSYLTNLFRTTSLVREEYQFPLHQTQREDAIQRQRHRHRRDLRQLEGHGEAKDRR
jgi:hypothetical protein